MAHFSYVYPVPTLIPADYPFVADLITTIIPPQNWLAVPGTAGQVFLYWEKHANTANTADNLYAEIYRSRDLETWELITVRQYSLFTEYVDTDVQTGYTYYYRARFIRRDSDANTVLTSEYTSPFGARVVTALGFEPRDEYANRFLPEMVSNMPGSRIYDKTVAGTFSADEQLWQTNAQIKDGFSLAVDGSVAHTELPDATARSKREVSFVLAKKHVRIKSQNLTTGEQGEEQLVNAYLIQTFLQSYANQFMTLNENYLQLIANKYIDAPQLFVRGFNPVVADEQQMTVAELYNTFGTLLNLQPVKAQQADQGLVRYKQLLQDSFTNVENTGKTQALNQACSDVFGITTQNLREYYKQHWFKSDRETKIYRIPGVTDSWMFTTAFAEPNSDLKYTLLDFRYTIFIEYVIETIGDDTSYIQVIGGLTAHPDTPGHPTWEANEALPETPYTYLFKVHLRENPVNSGLTDTTAAEIQTLFSTMTPAAGKIDISFPGSQTGAGAPSVLTPSPLVLSSLYVGWEKHELNLYGRKFLVQDQLAAVTTSSQVSASTSATLFKIAPDNHVLGTLPSSLTNEPNIDTFGLDIGTVYMLAARDDNDAGVSWGHVAGLTDYKLYGEKRACFNIEPNINVGQWITRATLKLAVVFSSNAGNLKLYRLRKRRSTNTCWNTRQIVRMPINSYVWNGTDYTNLGSTTQDWISEIWEQPGATGTSDAIFIKEFSVPRVAYDAPDRPVFISVDLTDVYQQLHKYESVRMDMGEDPENLATTGFMITAESMNNRSMVAFSSSDDTSFFPYIEYEYLPQGFYSCPINATTYFYLDGTTRYGRLLVQQATAEPTNYVRTVNELIRKEDIRFNSAVTLTLASAPTGIILGERLYDVTSGACGTVATQVDNVLTVNTELRTFHVGDDVRRLADAAMIPITITAVAYSGNKSVRLSHMPIIDSTFTVRHTGADNVDVEPPAQYPDYTPWTEAGDGIAPVFIATPTGVINASATQDVNEPDIINLNLTDDPTKGGTPLDHDVLVTYQYMYDTVTLGRVITDGTSITAVEGCNRVGEVFIQREADAQYKSDLLLPAPPASGAYPDISGLATEEYSDHNMDVLCQALHNVRRLDGQVDVFKQVVVGKPQYIPGQLYHQFFERT